MDGFDEIEGYLQAVAKRSVADDESKRVAGLLRSQKQKAVAEGDQAKAKLLWCYQEILEVQDLYIAAFSGLRSEEFFRAWRRLERIQVAWQYLEPHYNFEGDPHLLRFIAKQSEKLQSLFPYKAFFSPELIQKLECSICGAEVNPRKPCGHRTGEIYDGEPCLRRVVDVQVLSVSIVNDPGHKYSVLFPVDSATGKTYDPYNYAALKYLIMRLGGPFDPWDLEWTRRRQPHSDFTHILPTDPCPCESGKVYEQCCLRAEGVLRPHCDIIFQVPQDEGLIEAENA